MTNERSENQAALLSAVRKMGLVPDGVALEVDALLAVRNTLLTEREAVVMAPFLDELDNIIRALREEP